MIHLHQLPKLEGKNYSSSPFCLKMELYLKAMKINYQNYFNLELSKSPTGKMPYIETKGQKFADTSLIIQKLEKENDFFVDKHLDNHQEAIATSFARLCEDSLYWIMVYSRWADKDNISWKKSFINSIGLPKLMASIVYPAAKRNVLRQLKVLGLTSLTKAEVYFKSERDLKAIASFLDSKKYFFNDQISLLDITVFSFLIMIFDGSCGKRLQNLVIELGFDSFMKNMQQRFEIR